MPGVCDSILFIAVLENLSLILLVSGSTSYWLSVCNSSFCNLSCIFGLCHMRIWTHYAYRAFIDLSKTYNILVVCSDQLEKVSVIIHYIVVSTETIMMQYACGNKV